jgi:hypothetical protein
VGVLFKYLPLYTEAEVIGYFFIARVLLNSISIF